MSKKTNTVKRYVSVVIGFAVICIAFIITLALVQAKGPSEEYVPDNDSIRTVSVSGLRGEIYDRNGKLLVGNSTTYNLVYEYGAMPSRASDINAELLTILSALRKTGNKDKLADDYFPLDGVYPDVYYIPALDDKGSEEYRHFLRVLKRRGLSEDISATELAEFYVKKFGLADKAYTSEQTMQLMRIWYEMDRVDFGEYQGYTIAEDVPDELITLLGEAGLDGVVFKTVSKRVYNYPGVASHILGRVGKITAEDAEYYNDRGYPMDAYVGVSGCEYAFESILHGQDGKMVIEYDDHGNIVKKYYEKQPVSGNDIWLTIDIDLQIAAEEGLAEAAELEESSKGSALTAMNPNTGEVLAIASYPTFDLTKFSDTDYYASLLQDEKTPLLNRALSGLYAPGSTYKIGVALAALETGNTDTEYTCTCTGVYPDLGRPRCNGVHGENVDIFTAIQESCNIFFYELGRKMGINAITDYTKRLGLGTQTGIELGDKAGLVASPEYREENNLNMWGERDDLSAAIGQSDHGYTPLQLSVYMSSIVNGGKRYTAHILDSERHFYTDEALNTYTPTVADSVTFSDATYDTLIESMGRVVYENPEVKRYFKKLPEGIKAGGKTGTAEKTGQEDNALFCGFAPLESPQIVVSCIIEEGLHGYNAALPVGRVMEKYFENK